MKELPIEKLVINNEFRSGVPVAWKRATGQGIVERAYMEWWLRMAQKLFHMAFVLAFVTCLAAYLGRIGGFYGHEVSDSLATTTIIVAGITAFGKYVCGLLCRLIGLATFKEAAETAAEALGVSVKELLRGDSERLKMLSDARLGPLTRTFLNYQREAIQCPDDATVHGLYAHAEQELKSLHQPLYSVGLAPESPQDCVLEGLPEPT